MLGLHIFGIARFLYKNLGSGIQVTIGLCAEDIRSIQTCEAAVRMAFTRPDLGDALPLIASGKVRELYNVDSKSLLFVASDRISAYDVIMENVRLLLIYFAASSPTFECRVSRTRVLS